MKTELIPVLITLLGAAAVVPASLAAEPGRPPREDKRDLRVLAGPGPERERRPFAPEGERRERREMEKVTFLGVEVSVVPPALGAQLSLDAGTGLVVGHVAPRSPAAGVLQEHDILLKLDDQILIEARQLAVLVRNRKEGDEVTLTYLRAGQKATARVKLGVHEVPKFGVWTRQPAPPAGSWAIEPGAGLRSMAPRPEEERAHLDRVLSLLRRAPGAPDGGPPGFVPRATRIWIDQSAAGPERGRAMAVQTGVGTLVFSDDAGTLELTLKDGAKALVAKDAAGKEIFSGPVTTPEDRRSLPATVRERFERLEGMRDLSFRTDEDFQGVETRVVRPPGQTIAAPAPVSGPERLPDRI